MPGYAPQRVGAPGSKAPSTHLATYWWGLEEKVAKVILAKSIGQALGCLERCHGACKADERKRLETRHLLVAQRAQLLRLALRLAHPARLIPQPLLR